MDEKLLESGDRRVLESDGARLLESDAAAPPAPPAPILAHHYRLRRAG